MVEKLQAWLCISPGLIKIMFSTPRVCPAPPTTLPKLAGIETCLENEVMVIVPQLALSGISRDDARQKALQVGLQDLLGRLQKLVSKPVHPFEKKFKPGYSCEYWYSPPRKRQ
jgi:hypothetical protein